MTLPVQLAAGFALAAAVALAARRAGSLADSGAWSATLVGGLIFGLGGWRWAVLLLAFFFTSSGLSHAFAVRKRGLGEKYAKGHRRDAGQVLGNGGVAAVMALAHLLWPQAAWPWAAFAASLAAVNADTWATELGVFNPSPPRLLTNLRQPVEKGASGGVSAVGTLAAWAGAALIAGLAACLDATALSASRLLAAVSLAGLGGALFDSWLGATRQAMYRCPVCGQETEQHPRHRCGAPTVQVRGWGWLNNDWVNAASSLAAAFLGAALALL